jgi:hypothetical protein
MSIWVGATQLPSLQVRLAGAMSKKTSKPREVSQFKLPQKPQAALDQALELVRQFLTGRAKIVDASERVSSRLRYGDGTVELDRAGVASYAGIREAFEKYAELARTLTVRSVQRTVEQAAVQHFAHGDIAKTIAELRKKLTHPPHHYTVYIPIAGLDPASLPTKIGSVAIITIAAGRNRILEDKNPTGAVLIERVLAAWPPNAGALLVYEKIDASEAAAAEAIALEKARRLVDVLHFFSDGNQLFHDGLRLDVAAAVMRSSLVVAVDTETRDVQLTPIQTGSWLTFPLERPDDLAWDIARTMLGEENPTQVQQLLLNSMAWAGRATKEPRPDVAFAEFAIALESLIIPTKASEVTEQLATRTVLLLSAKVAAQDRLELYREVKYYYALRSNIVHNGESLISNVDLFGLHGLVKWVTRRMLRVCSDLARTDNISTLDDLEKWLKQLSLGIVTVPELSREG